MGTLVTIARRASAFRTAAGVFYALFETTYPKGEANPRPQSTCFAFGTFAHVMSWIFRGMASCESGLLQGANGLIDPCDYLRFWQHALRRPDDQFTQPVWIKASRERDATVPRTSTFWYDGDRLPFAVGVLRDHAYVDVATRVERGEEVIMDLHRDAAVLADIYGGVKDTRIEPWRIIQPHGKGEGNPALAPDWPEALVSIPRVSLYSLDQPSRLVAMVAGHRALIGSTDEILYDFIREVCPVLELRNTGSASHAIRAFRDALVRGPRPAPASMRLVIDKDSVMRMALHRGTLQSIEHLTCKGRVVSSGRLSVSVGSLRTAGLLHTATRLPSFCLDVIRRAGRTTETSRAVEALAA